MSSTAGEHTLDGLHVVTSKAFVEGRKWRELVNADEVVIGEIYSDNHNEGRTEAQAEANAARIVACVNALAGIPTDALPDLLGEVRGVVQSLADLDYWPKGGRTFPSEQQCKNARTLLAKLPVQS